MMLAKAIVLMVSPLTTMVSGLTIRTTFSFTWKTLKIAMGSSFAVTVRLNQGNYFLTHEIISELSLSRTINRGVLFVCDALSSCRQPGSASFGNL